MKRILLSLNQSIESAYTQSVDYFNDTVLHKNLLYQFFTISFFILFCISLAKLYKQHKYINVILATILVLSMPIAANSIGIIIPGSVSYIVMQYQYVLIVPFFLGSTEYIDLKWRIIRLLKATVYVTCFLITWTYIISANATYTCYELSYNHINFETSLVLSEVYKLPDYIPSETTIVFAGFPNAHELAKQIDIYKYAIHYTDNPVFWEDINGVSHNRWYYLMYYFGVDGKNLNRELYENAICSAEFKEMPVWPADGSVKTINGMAIVKFAEHPPLSY